MTHTRITILKNSLTLKIDDTKSDLQALERLADQLSESIGCWLTIERDTQSCCPRCDVKHRLYERHDLERCPYCHKKIV
ncbi:MAG TPA: hypothetical protein VJZ49_15530 [Syntrophales bacterium]|nr:hypothetical protein [Syntrophales bacterium]